jgi:hypothetical protein
MVLLPPTWHLLSVMVWLYHNANVYFSGLSALFCANKNDHRNGRIPPGKASTAPDIQVCYWPVIPDARTSIPLFSPDAVVYCLVSGQ